MNYGGISSSGSSVPAVSSGFRLQRWDMFCMIPLVGFFIAVYKCCKGSWPKERYKVAVAIEMALSLIPLVGTVIYCCIHKLCSYFKHLASKQQPAIPPLSIDTNENMKSSTSAKEVLQSSTSAKEVLQSSTLPLPLPPLPPRLPEIGNSNFVPIDSQILQESKEMLKHSIQEIPFEEMVQIFGNGFVAGGYKGKALEKNDVDYAARYIDLLLKLPGTIISSNLRSLLRRSVVFKDNPEKYTDDFPVIVAINTQLGKSFFVASGNNDNSYCELYLDNRIRQCTFNKIKQYITNNQCYQVEGEQESLMEKPFNCWATLMRSLDVIDRGVSEKIRNYVLSGLCQSLPKSQQDQTYFDFLEELVEINKASQMPYKDLKQAIDASSAFQDSFDEDSNKTILGEAEKINLNLKKFQCKVKSRAPGLEFLGQIELNYIKLDEMLKDWRNTPNQESISVSDNLLMWSYISNQIEYEMFKHAPPEYKIEEPNKMGKDTIWKAQQAWKYYNDVTKKPTRETLELILQFYKTVGKNICIVDKELLTRLEGIKSKLCAILEVVPEADKISESSSFREAFTKRAHAEELLPIVTDLIKSFQEQLDVERSSEVDQLQQDLASRIPFLDAEKSHVWGIEQILPTWSEMNIHAQESLVLAQWVTLFQKQGSYLRSHPSGPNNMLYALLQRWKDSSRRFDFSVGVDEKSIFLLLNALEEHVKLCPSHFALELTIGKDILAHVGIYTYGNEARKTEVGLRIYRHFVRRIAEVFPEDKNEVTFEKDIFNIAHVINFFEHIDGLSDNAQSKISEERERKKKIYQGILLKMAPTTRDAFSEIGHRSSLGFVLRHIVRAFVSQPRNRNDRDNRKPVNTQWNNFFSQLDEEGQTRIDAAAYDLVGHPRKFYYREDGKRCVIGEDKQEYVLEESEGKGRIFWRGKEYHGTLAPKLHLFNGDEIYYKNSIDTPLCNIGQYKDQSIKDLSGKSLQEARVKGFEKSTWILKSNNGNGDGDELVFDFASHYKNNNDLLRFVKKNGEWLYLDDPSWKLSFKTHPLEDRKFNLPFLYLEHISDKSKGRLILVENSSENFEEPLDRWVNHATGGAPGGKFTMVDVTFSGKKSKFVISDAHSCFLLIEALLQCTKTSPLEALSILRQLTIKARFSKDELKLAQRLLNLDKSRCQLFLNIRDSHYLKIRTIISGLIKSQKVKESTREDARNDVDKFFKEIENIQSSPLSLDEAVSRLGVTTNGTNSERWQEQKSRVQSIQKSNADLFQQLMPGYGKTSTFLPALVQQLATPQKMVAIVLPENFASLMESSLRKMDKVPTILNIEREMIEDIKYQHYLGKLLERAYLSGSPIIMTKDNLSLLSAIRYLDAVEKRQTDSLLSLMLNRCKENGVLIVDEMDTLFAPNQKTQIPTGKSRQPNMNNMCIAIKWFENLLSIKIYRDALMQNRLNDLNDEEKKEIKKSFEDQINLWRDKLSKEEEQFTQFLLRDLDWQLQSVFNRDVGISLLDRDRMAALPYSITGAAAEGSQFQHESITLIRTMALWMTPIGIEEIKRLSASIKAFWDLLPEEQKREYEPLTLKENVELELINLRKLYPIKFAKLLACMFVQTKMMKETPSYEKAIEMNPSDWKSSFFRCFGFSGTCPSDPLEMNVEVNQEKEDEIIKKIKKSEVIPIDGVRDQTYLEKLIDPDFSALIDLGCFLKNDLGEESIKNFARKVAEKTPKRYILFYVGNQLFALSKKEGDQIPTICNLIAGNVDSLALQLGTDKETFKKDSFVIYSYSKTVGTDFEFPDNAKALITFDSQSHLDGLIQASKRLRQLEKGQTLHFIIEQNLYNSDKINGSMEGLISYSRELRNRKHLDGKALGGLNKEEKERKEQELSASRYEQIAKEFTGSFDEIGGDGNTQLTLVQTTTAIAETTCQLQTAQKAQVQQQTDINRARVFVVEESFKKSTSKLHRLKEYLSCSADRRTLTTASQQFKNQISKDEVKLNHRFKDLTVRCVHDRPYNNDFKDIIDKIEDFQSDLDHLAENALPRPDECGDLPLFYLSKEASYGDANNFLSIDSSDSEFILFRNGKWIVLSLHEAQVIDMMFFTEQVKKEPGVGPLALFNLNGDMLLSSDSYKHKMTDKDWAVFYTVALQSGDIARVEYHFEDILRWINTLNEETRTRLIGLFAQKVLADHVQVYIFNHLEKRDQIIQLIQKYSSVSISRV